MLLAGRVTLKAEELGADRAMSRDREHMGKSLSDVGLEAACLAGAEGALV
jgi:hypothetical protein